MKQSITKAFIWLFAISALSLAACGDDDDDPDPGQTSCALTRVADDEGTVMTFEYNAEGYVIKTTETDDTDDSELITTYTYDSNKRVTRQDYTEDGEDAGYSTYTYNNGRVTSSNYYYEDDLLFTENFTYDANGRVSEITDDEGFSMRFTYNSAGNVTEAVLTIGDESYRIAYNNYDNKIAPLSAVKGYLNLYEPGINNPGSFSVYQEVDGDEELLFEGTYTYEYNNRNLPTRISENIEGDVVITNLTYQCN